MEITIILSACRWKSSFHQPADGNHYHSISLQMETIIILSACRWKTLSFHQPADGNHYHYQPADGNHYYSISLQMEITIIPSACRWKTLSFHQPADGKHYHSISLQMEITIIQSACRWKSWFAFSTFSGQPASPLEALFTNPLKTHKELSIKTQISTAVRLIFHRKKRTAEEGKNPLLPPPPRLLVFRVFPSKQFPCLLHPASTSTSCVLFHPQTCKKANHGTIK